MVMDTKIAGIPCQVRVGYVHVTKGNFSPQAETPDEYFGVREIEFTVCDRRGREAPWLANKLTEEDRQRIEDEILEMCDEEDC
jgi:hypothetical protein